MSRAGRFCFMAIIFGVGGSIGWHLSLQFKACFSAALYHPPALGFFSTLWSITHLYQPNATLSGHIAHSLRSYCPFRWVFICLTLPPTSQTLLIVLPILPMYILLWDVLHQFLSLPSLFPSYSLSPKHTTICGSEQCSNRITLQIYHSNLILCFLLQYFLAQERSCICVFCLFQTGRLSLRSKMLQIKRKNQK